MALPNPKHISEAVLKGIAAGHKMVLEQAKRTGVKLVVWKDGKVVHMTAEEIEKEQKRQ